MFPDPIIWRLHLSASPEKVFEVLNSDVGRAGFWAESAPEVDGRIQFKFVNGVSYTGRITLRNAPARFELEYFDSKVKFELIRNEKGGTDLTLTNTGVSKQEYKEVYAGWLSVLFALKGFLDFGIDLRNHDSSRCWDQGFIEN